MTIIPAPNSWTPDARERTEALNPNKSFIVEAPAGSGKTSILVQRFLRLLSLADRPECVVAMTFTRKAAAEMRERVLNALAPLDPTLPSSEFQTKTFALAQDVLKRDAEKGWNLLSDSGRLQIQTIDSLCATLTRHMPVASSLGGSPQVVEHAEELYRLAARRTLQTLAEGGEIEQQLFREVTLHFDNNLGTVEGQIASMLERREQWTDFDPSRCGPKVQAFAKLLLHAQRNLRQVFRVVGKVDFPAITEAAIKALGTPESPSDLLYWLDYRIQHLLVDEFQDTSVSQYNLIKALTEQWSDGDGRTLFLVGDPMQSIYRFRQAEVGLFLQSWEEEQLGSVRLTPLRLLANFRSTPEIVEWIGQTFQPIMTEDNKERGAVKLRSAVAVHDPSGIKPKFISLIENNEGLEEAAQVAQVVAKARTEGDVAILVRSRSHLAAILPKLREAGIDYEAVEIEQLREQQHILDVLSLTKALVHVGDRLSWLACLRAPWCGLNLSDLSKLAENETDTVLALLSRPDKIATLSVEGRERAIRLGEVLGAGADALGRTSLRDLVEQTWMILGGPATLVQSQIEDVQNLLGLIESYEEGGTLRDFSLLDKRLEFLYARPTTGPNCVKIMTVHTAKGLEFDTVILPRLGKQTQVNRNELLIWTEVLHDDHREELLVAAQPQRGESDEEYTKVKDALNLKEEEELKRLFYVATTRAKKQLILLGSTQPRKDRKEVCKPSSGTFMDLIWKEVEPQFKEALRTQAQWRQEDLFDTKPEPVNILQRLPARWHLPRFDRAVQWSPELQKATASARKISFDWVSDTGRHVGSLVHELLNRLAQSGKEGWSEDHLRELRPFVSAELLRLGVANADEQAASAQVLRALTNTVASDRGRWILQKRDEAYGEWTIGGRIGTRLINGTVDRAFRDEKGRFWIVDFKTSEHQGGRLSDFLEEQQSRYRSQLESYAALLAAMEYQPIFLGLYFPLLDAWREWEYRGEELVRTAS